MVERKRGHRETRMKIDPKTVEFGGITSCESDLERIIARGWDQTTWYVFAGYGSRLVKDGNLADYTPADEKLPGRNPGIDAVWDALISAKKEQWAKGRKLVLGPAVKTWHWGNGNVYQDGMPGWGIKFVVDDIGIWERIDSARSSLSFLGQNLILYRPGNDGGRESLA